MASTNVVNLDALIPREDMATTADLAGSKLDKIDIHHLETSFFLGALRKPDFQRETAHWSPDKVADLIRAFIDGDLIPAVILWQRGSHVFVIDGAHRLSALIAWVKDDYGDSRLSQEYFGGRIPNEQIKIAEKTRRLINESIGSFAEYSANKGSPQNAKNSTMSRRITNLAVNSIIAQWVPTVDEKAAEDSFFKINQAATPIDITERRILKGRQAANAVAARAIVHGGTGHKYWSHYASQIQAEIVKTARSIYSALYEPPMGEGPIKTLDIPVAGRGYSALPFVFDLVNWANSIPEETKTKDIDKPPPPDQDGTKTLEYLNRVMQMVQRITGTTPSSLGVHPVAYFYTRGGEFQPVVFLATAELINRLVEGNQLRQFTGVRRDFEEFLLAHKDFITLTIKSTGGGLKSLNRIVRYFQFIINKLEEGMKSDEIVSALQQDEFGYLSSIVRATAHRLDKGVSGNFTRRTKSASFLDSAVGSAVRCGICGAMIHRNSINFDHIQPKRDSSGTDASNAQVAHPYCNSIKN